MNQSSQTEIWQVEVGGQIYDAPFDELSEWIAEGSLHANDKVRRGNLRWVEAQRVPALVPFFNAKSRNDVRTPVLTTTEPPSKFREKHEPLNALPTSLSLERSPVEGKCVRHTDAAASYICTVCEKLFCRACPNSYGGTVRVCPDCGQLCRGIGDHNSSVANQQFRIAAASEGFGFDDFLNALKYPLRFRSSILIGGAMFAFLALGQSATALGGIFMAVAALFCLMCANALSFGVLSQVVDKFAQGNLHADFMPQFEDFSIWESILQPFFLSIAAYLVSFGPFILTMLVALYLVTSSLDAHDQAIMSDLEKIPGTNYYAGRKIADQSKDVKKVLSDISDKKAAEIDFMNDAATGHNSEITVDQDAKEQEELWELAQQHRKSQLESALGKTEESRQKEFDSLVSGFLELAAPVFVIGVITFLWGAFFFPAACAVAGYTRSFAATMNPTVGFDTIRRLGLDYAKILTFSLILLVIYGFVGGLLTFVLSPFDLPGMGNLPAKAANAFIGFYLFAVFACVLGYAFFKASDRLKLPR